MQGKVLSPRVLTFKFAAALDNYEIDVRKLAQGWRDPELFRRIQGQFNELRKFGASLPRLSVNWVAVLVSRARLLQELLESAELPLPTLQEHLAAVEGLRCRCLRVLGLEPEAARNAAGLGA